MSVRKRGDKWMLDFYPDGRNGKRVRFLLPETVQTREQALEIEQDIRKQSKNPQPAAGWTGNDLITSEQIEARIFWIQGKKVMLDRDLAELYGVETAQLTRQVRRNIDRFPGDFMFQLTREEFVHLKCHFGISSWGGTRKLPYVFTEQGVAMLSGVLHSKRAVQVNLQIMRTFIRLKYLLTPYAELKQKVEAMEAKYDQQFKLVFDTLRRLIAPEAKPKPQIGFHPEKD